jgi:hypothetical protein
MIAQPGKKTPRVKAHLGQDNGIFKASCDREGGRCSLISNALSLKNGLNWLAPRYCPYARHPTILRLHIGIVSST